MSDLQEVLVSMESVKEQIENARLLEELHKTPAFQKLILNGYFETEAQNLVGMMAHPMNELGKEQLTNKMIAISGLQAYFNMIYRKAQQAESSLKEHEATIAELSAEE